MATPHYEVILHALAPDLTDAGGRYADATLPEVPEEQLRQLLTRFAALTAMLAPTDTARPQIRIKSPAGLAIITAIDRKLYYGNWDTKGRGLEVSVDDIMAKVGPTAETPGPARRRARTPAPGKRGATGARKTTFIALLAAAIVVMNVTTAWMLLKPARTILPPHVFLSDTESDALLKRLAGAYQTGTREGDRHLQIEPLGLLRFTVYGKNRALRREHLQTCRGARTLEGEVVITDAYGVIRILDPNTIVVYGDTYRRIAN